MRRTIRFAASIAIAAGLLTAAPATATTSTPTPERVSASAVVPAATVAANARIRRVLPARIAAARPLGTNRAVRVIDLTAPTMLYRSRDLLPMRGASTTKLATAVTTLSLFEPADRPWPTRVLTGRGPREVVLVAGGDPMLSSAQLRALARRTALALLPTLPPPPTAAPAPTPSPTPTPTTSPSPAPSPTATSSPPPPSTVRIRVRVDDSLYPAPTRARGWPSHYWPWVVSPTRPLVRDLRSGWDSSADAARYFADALTAELARALRPRTDLIPAVSYKGRLVAEPTATELARFSGNSVGAALRYMLLVSHNNTAEMLFRNNAIAMGRPATWSAAKAASTKRLAALGVNVRGWLLYDGSGVSRSDRLTARGLVSLLRLAQSPSRPQLAPLLGYLPVGGVSGTLKAANGRYTTDPTRCARGLVYAKTGTLFDTVALAGYATGRDGRLRAFAVLVNNPSFPYSKLTVRRAVDRIPATLTGCY